MSNGIYSALSGAISDMNRVDLISHNLANSNSVGFKQFQMGQEGIKGTDGSSELTFAGNTKPEIDFTQGPLDPTGNTLDIALTEGVYMAVQTPSGIAYRRGGALMVRPDGVLTTEEGQAVLGKDKVISVPPDMQQLVTIGTNGSVLVDGSEVDRMRLVEFSNPKALQKSSGAVLLDSGAAGPLNMKDKNTVMVGYLEKSNLNLISGMTDLIAAHRSYEAALKAVETFSHIEKRAARELATRV